MDSSDYTALVIERLGAAQTTGFDISQKFIQQAVQLSAAAGTHCRFVCSNAYDISAEEFARYDLVVITAGALCFMPDLQKYFAIAQQLLKPGGPISIFESHPVTEPDLSGIVLGVGRHGRKKPDSNRRSGSPDDRRPVSLARKIRRSPPAPRLDKSLATLFFQPSTRALISMML